MIGFKLGTSDGIKLGKNERTVIGSLSGYYKIFIDGKLDGSLNRISLWWEYGIALGFLYGSAGGFKLRIMRELSWVFQFIFMKDINT